MTIGDLPPLARAATLPTGIAPTAATAPVAPAAAAPAVAGAVDSLSTLGAGLDPFELSQPLPALSDLFAQDEPILATPADEAPDGAVDPTRDGATMGTGMGTTGGRYGAR